MQIGNGKGRKGFPSEVIPVLIRENPGFVGAGGAMSDLDESLFDDTPRPGEVPAPSRRCGRSSGAALMVCSGARASGYARCFGSSARRGLFRVMCVAGRLIIG